MLWLAKTWANIKFFVIGAAGLIVAFALWLRHHDEQVKKKALYDQQKKKLEAQQKELERLREKASGEDATLDKKIEKNKEKQDANNRALLKTIEEGEARRAEIDDMSPDAVVARLNDLLNG